MTLCIWIFRICLFTVALIAATIYLLSMGMLIVGIIVGTFVISFTQRPPKGGDIQQATDNKVA